MTQTHTVTSLQDSPDSERRARMVRYTVAMGIRLACIGACFLVDGWWLLLPAFGAIFLPYFAVVTANSVSKKSRAGEPLRPGSLAPLQRS
jgi:fatty acid desaturase